MYSFLKLSATFNCFLILIEWKIISLLNFSVLVNGFSKYSDFFNKDNMIVTYNVNTYI